MLSALSRETRNGQLAAECMRTPLKAGPIDRLFHAFAVGFVSMPSLRGSRESVRAAE
jgi:hypothetical protein